jgi:hypothetical protein
MVLLLFGQVLPKGSLLTLAMSEAILTISENGTLRELEKKWFPVSLSDYVDPGEEDTQSLELFNFTYVFVISSLLAFLTVIHRCLRAVYPNNGDQLVVPEETLETRPAQEQAPQELMEAQQLEHVPVQQRHHNDLLQEIVHEMEDVPLHDEANLTGQQPLVPLNVDLQLGTNRPNQRYRHSASSANILTGNRVLLSFFSDRPKRAQAIEERSLRYSMEFEVEEESNLEVQSSNHHQEPSDSGTRFQCAASSSNISRSTCAPQSFYSLRSRRAQEFEDLTQ